MQETPHSKTCIKVNEDRMDTHVGSPQVHDVEEAKKIASELVDAVVSPITDVNDEANSSDSSHTLENLDEVMLLGDPENTTHETVDIAPEVMGVEDEKGSAPHGGQQNPADVSPADVSPADVSPADASPADASPAGASTLKRIGIIFVEGRLRDGSKMSLKACKNLQHDLHKRLTRTDQPQFFLSGEDLLADEYRAGTIFGDLFEKAKLALQSLKVVEYLGPNTDRRTHYLKDVRVNLQIYAVHTSRRAFDDEDFTQGDIMSMPHVSFDGKWEDLVFETDIKAELVWLMTNMLRFSQTSDPKGRDVNPLILLHGPPGTGKTTLCQGLAQKISVRLKESYDETLLVSIKTATLLSKYFSESAKQVDQIFTTLEEMCEDDPRRFICVLIDEVESIAGCRQASTDRGEAQDALRATNALITGLDRAKRFSNIIILCTSNMVDSLDAAFLDRCGLQLPVGPPTKASQYTILSGRLQRLIDRGVITSNITLPSFKDADLDFAFDPQLPSSKLYGIVKRINSSNISARSLIHLPEQAIMRYLRDEDCDLDMALGFIEQMSLSQQAQQQGKKRKREIEMDSPEEE